MARQSSFTEAEDRIILRRANQPAVAVNAALVAAGFEERTAQQLSQRRYYLRRRRPVAKVASSGSNAIIALEAERHEVLREIAAIDKQRTMLENRLRELTDALVNQMTAVETDLARVRRGHAPEAATAARAEGHRPPAHRDTDGTGSPATRAGGEATVGGDGDGDGGGGPAPVAPA